MCKIGGPIVLLVLFTKLYLSHCCKFSKEVAAFVWNPIRVDRGGYYFPMSWKPSVEQDERLPGVANDGICLSRFLASSTSTDTLYFNTCPSYPRFRFNCFHIGQKAWMLDCVYDTGRGSFMTKSVTNGDLPFGEVNNETTTQLPTTDVESHATDFSHTLVATLTDQKTFAFLNRCFYKTGNYDWIVLSTGKELPKDTRIAILSHARSLGYNNGALY